MAPRSSLLWSSSRLAIARSILACCALRSRSVCLYRRRSRPYAHAPSATTTKNTAIPATTPSTPMPLTAAPKSTLSSPVDSPIPAPPSVPLPALPGGGVGGGGGETDPGGGASNGAASITPSPAALYPVAPATPSVTAKGQINPRPNAPTYRSTLSSSRAVLSASNVQSRTTTSPLSDAMPAPSAPAALVENDESKTYAKSPSTATAPPFFAATFPMKAHRSHVNSPPWTLTAPPADASPSAIALFVRNATSTATSLPYTKTAPPSDHGCALRGGAPLTSASFVSVRVPVAPTVTCLDAASASMAHPGGEDDAHASPETVTGRVTAGSSPLLSSMLMSLSSRTVPTAVSAIAARSSATVVTSAVVGVWSSARLGAVVVVVVPAPGLALSQRRCL
mmetsp:Transcript_4962/g.22184  ORF Transcript_4962/g.22184 Transcript_4962/m.22184 type:complete len:394 (+) Transcript_4962:569-1750(+)